MSDCLEFCWQTHGCQGIVVRNSGEPVSCWRVTNVDVDLRHCVQDSSFDLYYIPDFFYIRDWEEVSGGYSERLYGAPGQISASTQLRILWPDLLSVTARQRIFVRCPWVRDESDAGPIFFFNPSMLQNNALWVHWSSEQLGPSTSEDHTWVEVTHCGYDQEGVHGQTPMWFLSATGSGVRVNVGRSLRLPLLNMEDRYADPGGSQYWLGQAHRLLVHGSIADAAGWLEKDLSAYDSVQFPKFGRGTGWNGVRFTEIIMLKMVSELDFLSQHLSELRCGPANAMRSCRSDDEAILQQSRSSCVVTSGNPPHEAMQAILRQSGCSDRSGG